MLYVPSRTAPAKKIPLQLRRTREPDDDRSDVSRGLRRPSLLGRAVRDRGVAAGCSHYNTPTQGVLPSDMAVQVRGEGLCFADILTWGPCWYYQKQFFQASIDPNSAPKSVLRYDVEVSGFPSSYWGHVVLLALQEQDFPGQRRSRTGRLATFRSCSGHENDGQ